MASNNVLISFNYLFIYFILIKKGAKGILANYSQNSFELLSNYTKNNTQPTLSLFLSLVLSLALCCFA